MKFFVLLTAMLGGFTLLVLQFSFWSVLGGAYLGAIGLVVLIAFSPRFSRKDLKQARSADTQIYE